MLTRFAVVGFGVMGQTHARCLSQLADVELAAIVDEKFSQSKISAPAGIPSLSSLSGLADFDISAAIVSTSTPSHETVACALMEMGINVLVEKPLADNLDACERMIAVQRATGVIGAVGHVERFNPVFQGLQGLVNREDFGKALQIETRRVGPPAGRSMGVGVALDLATHDIDITSSLLSTSYDTAFAQELRFEDDSNEVGIVASGRLSNGTLYSHVVNSLSPRKERSITLTLEDGTVFGDLLTGQVAFFQPAKESVEFDFLARQGGPKQFVSSVKLVTGDEPILSELRGFAAAVAGQAHEYVGFLDGASNVKVAEAFLESAKTGKVEQIP